MVISCTQHKYTWFSGCILQTKKVIFLYWNDLSLRERIAQKDKAYRAPQPATRTKKKKEKENRNKKKGVQYTTQRITRTATTAQKQNTRGKNYFNLDLSAPYELLLKGKICKNKRVSTCTNSGTCTTQCKFMRPGTGLHKNNLQTTNSWYY